MRGRHCESHNGATHAVLVLDTLVHLRRICLSLVLVSYGLPRHPRQWLAVFRHVSKSVLVVLPDGEYGDILAVSHRDCYHVRSPFDLLQILQGALLSRYVHASHAHPNGLLSLLMCCRNLANWKKSGDDAFRIIHQESTTTTVEL